MNINQTMKKNLLHLIIAIMLTAIGVTFWGMWALLHSKASMATIIQFLGVIAALMVGMITAVSSWSNTQRVIENNEKRINIVEKYELLLELNIKLERFKLQSKSNPFLKESIFDEEDYNSYLTLVEIQNILENNREVFLLLFPKTLLNYTQLKFRFSENINSVLPNNKSNVVLIELFKEIFKKTEHKPFTTFDLNLIQTPELADSILPRLKFIVQSQKEINIEDYEKGLIIFFNEINELIKIFNKEFEEQKINYEIYQD